MVGMTDSRRISRQIFLGCFHSFDWSFVVGWIGRKAVGFITYAISSYHANPTSNVRSYESFQTQSVKPTTTLDFTGPSPASDFRGTPRCGKLRYRRRLTTALPTGLRLPRPGSWLSR